MINESIYKQDEYTFLMIITVIELTQLGEEDQKVW